MREQTLPLSAYRDIIPAKEIDISYTLYLVATLVVMVAIVYLVYRYRTQRIVVPTPKEQALSRLRALDLSGVVTKEMLYSFTLDTQIYLEGESDMTLEQILELLTPYKYHHSDVDMEPSIIAMMSSYIEELE